MSWVPSPDGAERVRRRRVLRGVRHAPQIRRWARWGARVADAPGDAAADRRSRRSGSRLRLRVVLPLGSCGRRRQGRRCRPLEPNARARPSRSVIDSDRLPARRSGRDHVAREHVRRRLQLAHPALRRRSRSAAHRGRRHVDARWVVRVLGGASGLHGAVGSALRHRRRWALDLAARWLSAGGRARHRLVRQGCREATSHDRDVPPRAAPGRAGVDRSDRVGAIGRADRTRARSGASNATDPPSSWCRPHDADPPLCSAPPRADLRRIWSGRLLYVVGSAFRDSRRKEWRARPMRSPVRFGSAAPARSLR